MKTSCFNYSQIITILKQAEMGSPVTMLCREHGISNSTFLMYHAKYSTVNASLIARPKELKPKIPDLKMHAENRLKAEIFKEIIKKSGKVSLAKRDDTTCNATV